MPADGAAARPRRAGEGSRVGYGARVRVLPLLLLVSSCSAPAPADVAGGPFEVESEAGLCGATVELGADKVRRGVNRFLVSLTPQEAELTAASGLMVAPGVGLQYAMADSWSAYVKYAYVMCLGSEFAPGDLLQPPGGGEPVPGDTQIYTTLGVGVMLRF